MREGDSWIDRQVSPSFLLLTGLFLAPAVVLQQNLIVKAVQTTLFFTVAVLSITTGRRRLVIGSVIFMATTIVVNLFSPLGRIVLQFGPLRITLGALDIGISKATTLVSLLYVSRICVRSSVRLPGILGRYVSQTLDYLNELLSRRERLTRHNLVQRLDDLFEGILDFGAQQSSAPPAQIRNTAVGVVTLVSVLVVNWGALFFPFSALLGAS
ncbi:MAG: hypothetical protein JSV89_12395 [Spirochaetaceae bacterium]|nr:MAG: hypothetical protein JSV89_12395 [Spirochaetaceae bacterium]